MVQLLWNEKQTYRLNSRAPIWPSGLTLAMTFWPWIFKVKYRICYISAKNGPIATKRKSKHIDWTPRPQMWPLGLTLTFEFWRSNVTLTFDHTHDLDHGFSWSNFEIAVSQNGKADWHCTKGVAVGHSWPWSLTIWWPKSGAWIYQIVNGVTSVVGVPSTHLVVSEGGKYQELVKIFYSAMTVFQNQRWLPIMGNRKCQYYIYVKVEYQWLWLQNMFVLH